jgi:hypothetical protein
MPLAMYPQKIEAEVILAAREALLSFDVSTLTARDWKALIRYRCFETIGYDCEDDLTAVARVIVSETDHFKQQLIDDILAYANRHTRQLCRTA